jgi:hypothetical protein
MMSGRCVGAGVLGAPITGAELGWDPQLPELCDTTRGCPPFAGELISTLWVQTPPPDQVDTIV